MHTWPIKLRIGLALALVMLVGSPVAAQQGDVFASSPGAARPASTDTGPCQDRQIAIEEGRRHARAYRDTDGRIQAAVNYLATKYGDPSINRGGVCANAPGVIYFVDNRFDAEFHDILSKADEFNANPRQPPGPSSPQPDSYSVSPPGQSRLSSISSTGCHYPGDIDPNRMSPMIPAQARIGNAEAAFMQRVRLCRQGQGGLVKGGCASVCEGKDVFATAPPAGGKSIHRTGPGQPAPRPPRQAGDLRQGDRRVFYATSTGISQPGLERFPARSA